MLQTCISTTKCSSFATEILSVGLSITLATIDEMAKKKALNKVHTSAVPH